MARVIDSAYAAAFRRADQAETPDMALKEVEGAMTKYPYSDQIEVAKSRISRTRVEMHRQDQAVDAAINEAALCLQRGVPALAESRLDEAIKANPWASRTPQASNMLCQARVELAMLRKSTESSDYAKKTKGALVSKELIEYVQQSAERGIPEAQRDLGVMLANGTGLPKNEYDAVAWFRKAAEQGLSDAQSYLGWHYDKGCGTTVDKAEAVKWYRRSADQGFAEGQCHLGWCYGNGNGVDRNPEESVKWFRKAADQGHAMAQCNLGTCYDEGRGVARSPSEAAEWYRRSAEQGFAQAESNLGVCYKKGEGVAKDPVEAAKWLRRGAEQGYAPAQYNLALSYAHGEGVAKNDATATEWFRKAAEQGLPQAQYNLAVSYTVGRGVSANLSEATRWYTKAAEQGDANAIQRLVEMGIAPSPQQVTASADTASNEEQDPQSRALLEQGLARRQNGESAQAARYFRLAADRGSAWGRNNLGCCYMEGEGVPRDAAEGARWLAKAASQGLREAQAALGSCYTLGLGVERNARVGAQWYTKAAEQGDAVAQRQLSLMYAVGMGVQKSNTEAVRWAREAASKGDPQAGEWIAKWDARRAPSAPTPPATSMGHRNPWGQAGERVVGAYASLGEALRAKQGMTGLVNANLDALDEQVINEGSASMTVQRPPEYRVEADHEKGVWLLIEQKF
jgi:TPR repeat protein